MDKVARRLHEYFVLLKKFELLYRRNIRIIAVVIIGLLALIYLLFLRAPYGFPTNQTIHIPDGASLKDVTDILYANKVIRYPFLFKFYVYIIRSDKEIMAGDYLFNRSAYLPRVASRLIHGEFNLTPIKVTIPEGYTINQMADNFEKNIPAFDRKIFTEGTLGKEGHLFPDTYFFFPNVSTKQVITDLEANFKQKISVLMGDISKSGRSESDVIIMASILEKEARSTEDRKIISGILWKRIKIGMPIQVDAVFVYSTGKGTYSLTTKDLNTDSPYNTYTRKGLPPGPIGNPGLDSILAAINPTESPYLYYLSDREGNIYYSATFDKHKKKKVLYIN